ncbi:MAG TPA: VanZ family protein [Clostridia bacterium]|nr:VanZ family protein [Clostridia bacterium]
MRLFTYKAGLIKIFVVIAFVLYLSFLFYLTFFSHLYGRSYFHRSMNLVPFATVRLFLASGHIRAIIINIFGNIAAFIPMGLLLPLVFRKLARFYKTLGIAFGISLMVETVQYAFGVGAADVDDLMLNLAGSLLGYLLFSLGRLLYRRMVKSRQSLVG